MLEYKYEEISLLNDMIISDFKNIKIDNLFYNNMKMLNYDTINFDSKYHMRLDKLVYDHYGSEVPAMLYIVMAFNNIKSIIQFTSEYIDVIKLPKIEDVILLYKNSYKG